MESRFVFLLLLIALTSYVHSAALNHDLIRRQRQALFHEDPEVKMTTEEIIEYHGYPFESYTVKTEDKYTLTVHRIPHSRNVNSTPTEGRPVVFLQHGFDGSSADWVLNLPNQAPAYVFADAGFDVWMGNFRGNRDSKNQDGWKNKHDYWQFSWDEMAQYDLPAMIDLALNVSKADKLFYIAHSLGSTTGFAKFSEDREFGKKIRKFYALGPIVTMKDAKGPLRYIAKFAGPIQWLTGLLGADEFSPNERFMQEMAKYVCGNMFTSLLCENVLFLIGGPDSKQLNSSRIPVYVSHSPGGTSTQNVIHFTQMIKTGQFQKYDYGSGAKNQQHYHLNKPPVYDVTKMQVPVVMYTGDLDWLADPEDVKRLIPNLRSLDHHVALQGFNHFDFIWGLRAPPLIYWPIIDDVRIAYHEDHPQESLPV